jgi:hypothetical protein
MSFDLFIWKSAGLPGPNRNKKMATAKVATEAGINQKSFLPEDRDLSSSLLFPY